MQRFNSNCIWPVKFGVFPNSVIRTSISVLLLMVAGQSSASAYLDLGTGSFILQAVLAGLAAAWLTCSTYWQRIKNLFQKKSPEPEPATTTPAATTSGASTPAATAASATTEKSEQRDAR